MKQILNVTTRTGRSVRTRTRWALCNTAGRSRSKNVLTTAAVIVNVLPPTSMSVTTHRLAGYTLPLCYPTTSTPSTEPTNTDSKTDAPSQVDSFIRNFTQSTLVITATDYSLDYNLESHFYCSSGCSSLMRLAFQTRLLFLFS